AETVDQVSAIDKIIEVKDITTRNGPCGDEFDALTHDLSLNLLFEGFDELQKSTPSDVIGSAEPSQAIEKKYPTITVPLVINKVETKAVIDTGAEVTVLSEELYSKIPKDMRPELKKATRNLVVAEAGKHMTTRGIAQIEMKLGNEIFTWPMYVAPIGDNVLLGCDLIDEKDITINCKRGLQLNGEWIECQTTRQIDGIARVRIKEAITIPANSEIIIAGEGYDTEGLSSRYSILEPVVEDSRKIMVARTLVDAHSCKVPVRLINLDEHPVKLRKNYLLGELHPVQDISEVIDLEEKKINRCGTSTNSCSIHSKHSVTLQDFLTDQGNKEAVKIPESWTESSEIRKISGAENDGNQMNKVDIQMMPDFLQDLYERSSKNLTDEVNRQKLRDLLLTNKDAFASNRTELGTCALVKHKIDTAGAAPIRQPLRRTPIRFEGEEMKNLKDQLDNGVIRPSTSPWASNVVLVRKKDQTVRLDYNDQLCEHQKRDEYKEDCKCCKGLMEDWQKFKLEIDNIKELSSKIDHRKDTESKIRVTTRQQHYKNPGTNRTWLAKYTNQEMSVFQKEDENLKILHQWMSSGSIPDRDKAASLNPAVRRYWLNWQNVVLVEGVIFQKWILDEDGKYNLQLIVPAILQKEIMINCHDTPFSGHLGVAKTKDKMRQNFTWYGIGKDVTSHIKMCQICNRLKNSSRKPTAPLVDYRVAYRSSPHPATGHTPNFMMLGREINISSSILFPFPKEKDYDNEDQYITRLRAKMMEVYSIARNHLKSYAERQKRDHDTRIFHKEVVIVEMTEEDQTIFTLKEEISNLTDTLVKERNQFENYLNKMEETKKNLKSELNQTKAELHVQNQKNKENQTSEKEERRKDRKRSYQEPNKRIRKTYYSCRDGDIEALKLCLQNGADIDYRDVRGWTALMRAASGGGHLEICRLLIDRGCKIDITKNIGETALHCAAREGYLQITRCLVEQGGASPLVTTHEEGVDGVYRYWRVWMEFTDIGGCGSGIQIYESVDGVNRYRRVWMGYTDIGGCGWVSALFASCCLKAMAIIAENWFEDSLQHILEEHSNLFAKRAEILLDKMFKHNEEMATDALDHASEVWSYVESPLHFGHQFCMEEFISHRSTQKDANTRLYSYRNGKASNHNENGKKDSDGNTKNSDEITKDSDGNTKDSDDITKDSDGNTKDSNKITKDSDGNTKDSNKITKDSDGNTKESDEITKDSDGNTKDSDEITKDSDENKTDSSENKKDNDENTNDTGTNTKDIDENRNSLNPVFLDFIVHHHREKQWYKYVTAPVSRMMINVLIDLLYYLVILMILIVAAGTVYHANIYPNYDVKPFPDGIQNWRIWTILRIPYWQVYGELFLDTLEEITITQDVCAICKKDTHDDHQTVKLREKGSIRINIASKERGDNIVTKSGQIVHEQCRRTYTNVNSINALKRKPSEPVNEPPILRSEKQFDFKDDCLFCGASVIENAAKRKTFEVHAVRTTEFQKSIEQICDERNDEWAIRIKGRIAFARDLHAADAVYHKVCSINFRTHKGIPQVFSPSKIDKDQCSRGRPSKAYENFLEVTRYLEENDMNKSQSQN
ncbi:Hypothetical predicted protein, partial [Mytilus galloprovincialis]